MFPELENLDPLDATIENSLRYCSLGLKRWYAASYQASMSPQFPLLLLITMDFKQIVKIHNDLATVLFANC